ncbi:hypothetical protein EMCRGX_G005159 [Ephydatia muelleri]
MLMDRHRQLDKMAPCTVKPDLELVQLMATKVQGAPSAKLPLRPIDVHILSPLTNHNYPHTVSTNNCTTMSNVLKPPPPRHRIPPPPSTHNLHYHLHHYLSIITSNYTSASTTPPPIIHT